MSKIALIGITLISLLTFSGNSLESEQPGDILNTRLEKSLDLHNSVEYMEFGDDCSVSTHGYAMIDGVAVYLEITVNGPCDASIADKVRAAIRAIRGIK